MSVNGGGDLLVRSRSVLLDALSALAEHRDALVLVGAQAIYLHTGDAPVALAEATKDSDLAIDARLLGNAPLLDKAMSAAGFHQDVESPQPGAWLSADGIPVDLMVPEALSGGQGRRGASIPPHPRGAARRALGLEAAVVDHFPMRVTALAPADDRCAVVNVAGPAALLVAKLHKIGERLGTPGRLADKDAHDIYRLLVSVPTEALAVRLGELAADELAGPVTRRARVLLKDLFADGPGALGARMAGRAEDLIGDPAVVAAASAALAGDVLADFASRLGEDTTAPA